VRICFGDYDRELALVAEVNGTEGPEIIGVGRMNRIYGTDEADVAVLVTDAYQNRGLGEELLRRVMRVAKEEGVCAVSADMMPDNVAMSAICKRLGFNVKMADSFSSLHARLEI